MLTFALLLALSGVTGTLAGGPDSQRILWDFDTFSHATRMDAPQAEVLRAAEALLGAPYHYAGSGPGLCPSGTHAVCADCSGLVCLAYAAAGIAVPRTSAELANAGQSVPRADALPGDILIFQSDGIPNGQVNHAGIYFGNGLFLHAGSRGVRLDDLDGPYWGDPRRPRLRDIRRVMRE